MAMTINESLGVMKQLKQRHKELTDLRTENRTERIYHFKTEKEYTEVPAYDIKAIDKKAQAVAKQIRLLDAAIKKANAVTEIDFELDETVLDGIE